MNTESPTLGWNKGLRLAWRKKADGGLERSLPPEIADDVPSDQPLVATFWDNTTATVPGMTVGTWRLQLAQAAQRHSPPLYSRVVDTTKHELSIRQRVDRMLLLSLYEQSRQILQVRTDKFGALEDNEDGRVKTLPNGHPTLLRAVEFMSSIADMYATGQINQEFVR